MASATIAYSTALSNVSVNRHVGIARDAATITIAEPTIRLVIKRT